MKEQEPPDSWDMESDSTQPVIQKPWRGAAVLISKVPVASKKQNVEPKQVSYSLIPELSGQLELETSCDL
jgi:hypothetical protein